MTSPMITALMTTFNSAAYVKETIDSILRQTFSDFEFLILDDGSKDDTVEIIKSYCDRRIRLIEYRENRGVGYRLNQALNLIGDTQYIAKVDSDDISRVDRFQLQYDFLQENLDFSVVKTYVEYFADTEALATSERFLFFKNKKEAELNSINTAELIDQQLRRWLCFLHTTYMARTSIVKKVGYPESRMYEDYSLFYRMLMQGCKFGCVCKPLVKVRITDTSTTMTRTENYLDTGISAIVDFKFFQIKELLRKKRLFIFGSGQLARSLCRVLQQNGIVVEAMLDRRRGDSLVLELGLVVPVQLVTDAMPDKSEASIIIAAQPVRDEICDLMEKLGWQEWQDYIVIA